MAAFGDEEMPASAREGRALAGPAESGSPTVRRRSRYQRDHGSHGVGTGGATSARSAVTALTPAKLRLLGYLAECRILSLPQLAWLNDCANLYTQSSAATKGAPAPRGASAREKSARRHLRALFDAGLVDVLPVSRAALASLNEPAHALNDARLLFGSAPNVYAPTRAGLRLLYEAGRIDPEIRDRPLPAYGPRNGLFLAHELRVRDMRVWLERCVASAGAPAETDLRVDRWRDGSEASICLEGSGQARTSEQRKRISVAAPRRVSPDAWFVLRLGAAGVLVGLVEVDRGTERGTRHWDEKLAGYAALFAGGPSALKVATGYERARLLVVTPDARRRDHLAECVWQRSREALGVPWLAGRFWLAEEGALLAQGRADLAAPLWRQPGGKTLESIVPSGSFKASPEQAAR